MAAPVQPGRGIRDIATTRPCANAWRRTWEDATAGEEDAVARLDEREVTAIAEQALAAAREGQAVCCRRPIIIATCRPAPTRIRVRIPRVLGLFNGTPYSEGAQWEASPG